MPHHHQHRTGGGVVTVPAAGQRRRARFVPVQPPKMEMWYFSQYNPTGDGGRRPFLFTLLGDIMSLERFINDLRGRPVQSWAEKTAIVTIVVEILKEIGWSLFDIAHEVEVGSKRNKGRVDIKLSAGKKSVLMECKAPRVNLDDADALEQLLRYAFHDGARLSVLTNGVTWDFYLPFAEGPAGQRKFASIGLLSKEEPDDLIAELRRFLGRDAIASGEAEAAAKERMETKQRGEQIKDVLPAAWSELTVNPPEELINLIANEVQRRIGHSPDDGQIRAFLLQSANAIPERVAAQQRPPSPPATPRSPSIAGRRPARSLRGYTLWGRYTEVPKWKQLYVKVCAQVYERHGKEFFRLEEEMRSRGKKWFARSPGEINNPNVDPMQIPGSPYYVDAHDSAKRLENRCRRVLAFFGHSESDLRIHEASSP